MVFQALVLLLITLRLLKLQICRGALHLCLNRAHKFSCLTLKNTLNILNHRIILLCRDKPGTGSHTLLYMHIKAGTNLAGGYILRSERVLAGS